jgi:hypothetical protein
VFTALMSLGMVGLVVVYGIVFSKTMDEMLSNAKAQENGHLDAKRQVNR